MPKLSIRLFALLCCLVSGVQAAPNISQAVAPTEITTIKLDSLQSKVEEALVWRSKAMDFAQQAQQSIQQGHLSPTELQTFITGAQHYMEIREQILQLATDTAWLVNETTEIEFATGQMTSIKQQGARTLVTLNPADAQGRVLLKQMKISLAAALVLYDNYLLGIHPFWNNQKLRYLLNHDNPQIEGQLDKITTNYLALAPRRKVALALNWHERARAWQKKQGITPDAEEDYLNALIEQSPTQHYLRKKGIYDFKNRAQNRVVNVTDKLYFLQRAFTFVSSKTFGNAVGLIEFRKGLLANLSDKEQKAMADTMQPLDILLEKTPFRLTDKFIPGHYGHVAIWAGNEQQLKALGIWEHPAIVKHHASIRAGNRIVEALRSGVEINPLARFLNIDDLLVLRQNTLSDDAKRDAIVRLFQQVGKEYDFNFDVETDRRIVCSELAYVVYPNITWTTPKSLGRYTISPDNVAIQALNGGPLQPVLIYRDGKKVQQNLTATLQQLLNGG